MASGETLFRFHAEDNKPPTSNYATVDFRNSDPLISVLDFDDTTDEEAQFKDVVPSNYDSGGFTIEIGWMATDTTVGPQNAVFQVATKTLTEDVDDLDSAAFGSFQSSGAVSEASVSGEYKIATITMSHAQAGSPAPGEAIHFKVRRDADDTSATDSLTGDAELLFMNVLET